MPCIEPNKVCARRLRTKEACLMNWRPITGAGRTAYSPHNSGGKEQSGSKSQERRGRKQSGAEADGNEANGNEAAMNQANRRPTDRMNTDEAHRIPVEHEAQASGLEDVEEAQWAEWMSDESLPDDFTDRLMAELEGVEIDMAENSQNQIIAGSIGKSEREYRVEPISEQPSERRGIKRKNTRRKRAKIWVTAALVLLLAGGTVVFTQPSIAERMMSLFSPELELAPDRGMKEARDAGMLQHAQAGAEDQGYKVSVDELIADSNRLVIGIAVTNPDGSPYTGQIYPNFRITDGNYHEITSGSGDIAPGSVSKYNMHFTRPVLTPKLSVQVEINRLEKIDASGNVTGTLSGEWNFSVEADLSKAAAKTLQTPINASYTTPGGVIIDMLGATRTPSGGSLEYETSLTPEASALAAGGAIAYRKIDYHLEDAKGKMISDGSTAYQIDPPFAPDRWSHRARIYNVLDNFPYDKQPLRFVLDSYTIREKSNASVSFDPAALSADKPATLEQLGDKMTLTGFRIDRDTSVPISKSDDASSPKVGAIKVTGITNNPFVFDKWVAIDDKGKQYEVSFIGSSSPGADQPFEGEFLVKGMSQAPAKLTLKRTQIDHVYRDAKWSFEIPQTGTPMSLSESP
ncbi:hypothetical protein B9G55_18465 [Saccharibacillus sp. O16]|nr:hypothetical protein B9G55_18465 [Saccharibacillus sp. O16]